MNTPAALEGNASEMEALLKEQVELRARLLEIKSRIKQLQGVKKNVKKYKSRQQAAIISKWLELQNRDAVALVLGVSKREVNSAVNASFQRRLKSGELNKEELFKRWVILRNFDQVAQAFNVPEYLVRNVVRKMLKFRKP